MNAGLAHSIESLFGPPSESIDITAFLESASVLSQDHLEPEVSSDIFEECSLADIHQLLSNAWSNPTLSAHLTKDHDHIVSALHAAVNPKYSKSGRKAHLPDPDTLSIEVTNLQKNLDTISLKSFRLNTDAVLFMRTPKNSDHNILDKVQTSAGSVVVAGSQDAVLIISIHDRVLWGPSYVARSSQHAFLSSQTLQDLCRAIPCVFNDLPLEVGMSDGSSGCVICLEGCAYGNVIRGDDYGDKLIKQLDLLGRKGPRLITKAPSSLQDTKFASLSLRINEPYWLIHRGNCEHFVVVDQIRLLHPSDPRAGYPLKLQITPPLLDLCRACTKVPAVWSIVGDIRLGESPCVLCGPCWRNMGEPEEEGVIVLPLPECKHDRCHNL